MLKRINRVLELTKATSSDEYFEQLEKTASEYRHQSQVCEAISDLNSLKLEDDDVAEEAGRGIIRLFDLKPNANGRYDLYGGDKTAKGLARTVLRALYDDTFFDD